MEEHLRQDMEELYDKLQEDLKAASHIEDDLRTSAAGYAHFNDIEWDEKYIGEEVGEEALKKDILKASKVKNSLEEATRIFEESESYRLQNSYQTTEFCGTRQKAKNIHSDFLDLYLEIVRADERLGHTLDEISKHTQISVKEDEESSNYGNWARSQLYTLRGKTSYLANP